MAQYNYPTPRRPRYDSRQPSQRDGLIDAMNNRVFVPKEPIIPAAPMGVDTPTQAEVDAGTHWIPGHIGATENPFFKGDQSKIDFKVPQGVQYYGDGGGQTSMPMEEFLYQKQSQLEGQKAIAEQQLQADQARLKVNENLMTGQMDPGNPLVVESMQAMGMEVTPSMLGQKTPNPNLVIQNIYGPGVASGSVPNKQQNMIIEARRTGFANLQARKNQYVEENRASLTEADILGFEKQAYDAYPEFAEGIEAPKTSDEILAEREEAKKQDFIKRTSPVAALYGIPEMPYKTGKNGDIEVDATTVQALMSAKNNSRQNLNSVSSQAYNLANATVREIEAAVPPKPKDSFAPGYEAWVAADLEARKKKTEVWKKYRQNIESAGASPDPRTPDGVDTPEGTTTPAADPVSEEIPAYSAGSIDAAAEKGLIVPGKPLYYEGVLGTFDEQGRWTSLNR